MKKYKLEITIAAIFGALLTGLLWQTMAGFSTKLPYALLVVFVGLLASVVFYPNKEQDGVHEKYAPRFFAMALVSSVIGIVIIVGVAMLLNTPRFSKTFDLTERKVNSLSDETLKFISSLEKEVEIYCVPSTNPGEDYCGENQLLRQLYAQNSKGKIAHTAINPTDIQTLQRVRPAGYSRLVILMKNETNRSEVVGKVTESKLTNALINMIKSKKTVYFLAGSGEPSINADGEKNYSALAEVLRNRAYDVKEHVITNGDLPADAQLVVAGDTPVGYSVVVENMLRKFIGNGGKLILVVNPYRAPGLNRLLSDIGIKLENTLLINNGGATQLGAQLSQAFAMRPPIVIGEYSRESPMTSPIPPNQVGIVDGARPMSIDTTVKQEGAFKLKHTTLISAFHAAPVTMQDDQRNKLNLEGTLGVKPDPNFDVRKTYPVAIDVEIEGPAKLAEGIPAAQLASKDGSGAAGTEKKSEKAQVVVYGFQTIGQYAQMAPGNSAILPLAVSHLYQDKELVTIPNKDFAPKQFNLDRNPAQFLFLFAGLLPVLTLLMGMYIWMRRRSA